MGQCVSHPEEQRRRRGKLVASLRESVSRRATRLTQRYRQQHHPRRQEEPQRQEEPYTSTGHPSDVPVVDEGEPPSSIERGSHAITNPSQDMSSHLLEAPRPRKPHQDDQEEYEQDSDVEFRQEEPLQQKEARDEFPAGIDEDLFRSKLAELLERELSAKDKQFPSFVLEDSHSKPKMIPDQTKKVAGETLKIHLPADRPPVDSTQLEHTNIGTSSGSQPASPGRTMIFGPQSIGEEELLFDNKGDLGGGRFGRVHLARWRGAEVAVKEFYSKDRREAEKSQKQEIRTLSMLKHPNVVTLYGTSMRKGHPTIVLEYVQGRSLRQQLQKLKRQGTLSVKTKFQLALQAAIAMDYLHSRSIIHFDVKADNFLCDMRDQDNPIVKVADVGLSKHKVRAVVDGSMRGTLPWMAPELFPQIQSVATVNRVDPSRGVDNKVDVYSFGIVMWEIWTMGSEPYGDKHAHEVFFRILQGTLRPDIPDDIDPDWKDLMVRCWDANTIKRPPFEVLANHFAHILEKMSTAVRRR